MSSAHNIARVIEDLKKRRVRRAVRDHRLFRATLDMVRNPMVVDATAIYGEQAENPQSVHLYEDHPCIAPPFHEVAYCYENQHGNVIVSQCVAFLFDDDKIERWEVPGDHHAIEWDRVKWVIDNTIWLGGTSRENGGPIQTSGPMHMEQYAVYEDGVPADLHWVQLRADVNRDLWDMAQLVTLGSMNFLNCRNIELVEPVRDRAERRRIERTGQRVHTINVFPVGKTTRGTKGEPVGGVPVHPVRGHFAHYGEQYGRGLLFGKYEGKFFIQQHARGSAENGSIEHDYKLVTEAT